jgi:hypothetical protein
MHGPPSPPSPYCATGPPRSAYRQRAATRPGSWLQPFAARGLFGVAAARNSAALGLWPQSNRGAGGDGALCRLWSFSEQVVPGKLRIL